MRTDGRPSGVAVASATTSGSIGDPHFASSYHARKLSSGFAGIVTADAYGGLFTTREVYRIATLQKGTIAKRRAGTKIFCEPVDFRRGMRRRHKEEQNHAISVTDLRKRETIQ